MARPVTGKTYLFVVCKRCEKAFRVIDEPLFEGQAIGVRPSGTLKCRGCGFEAEYSRREMHIAKIEPDRR
jgi:hypothetical protein